MAFIEWDDQRFILGVEQMDNTHIEFVDIINSMDGAPDAEFVHIFERLLEHTRAHFDSESRLMIEHGFPATAEHQSDHERVLGDMTRFSRSVHKGLIVFGRNYVRDSLVTWFPVHAATMDSALAAYLKSRLTEPKPIPVNIE
jgi:hemerythrin-like metal-binding protein